MTTLISKITPLFWWSAYIVSRVSQKACIISHRLYGYHLDHPSSSSTSSTIPLVGLIVVVKAFKFPSSSLSESSSGLVSLKVAASALLFPMFLRYVGHLFHVTEALTPKALKSWRNSVLNAIPSILFLFILALELWRTGLPTVLLESLPISILHEFLELLEDFILESSSFEDSSVSLLLAFNAMLLPLPDLLILVNPSS